MTDWQPKTVAVCTSLFCMRLKPTVQLRGVTVRWWPA
jgi:hypothetical protein